MQTDLPWPAATGQTTIKIVDKKPQTRDWLVCMPLASYGMLRVFSCSGTCNFCSLLGCIQIWNERHQSFRHVSTWSAMGPVTFNIVQKWNSKSTAHVGNIFVLSWWLKRWMSCTLGKGAHVSLEPGHPHNQEVSGTMLTGCTKTCCTLGCLRSHCTGHVVHMLGRSGVFGTLACSKTNRTPANRQASANNSAANSKALVISTCRSSAVVRPSMHHGASAWRATLEPGELPMSVEILALLAIHVSPGGVSKTPAKDPKSTCSQICWTSCHPECIECQPSRIFDIEATVNWTFEGLSHEGLRVPFPQL